MNKVVWLILMSICLISCKGKQDEAYYLSHPKALQQALHNCKQEVNGLTCQELQEMALKLNTLANELQSDPQGFGNRIIKLQEIILSQEASKNQTNLENNKKELADLMAIVKWMEAPES